MQFRSYGLDAATRWVVSRLSQVKLLFVNTSKHLIEEVSGGTSAAGFRSGAETSALARQDGVDSGGGLE